MTTAEATTTELDRLWKSVNENPEDFATWEQLIRVAEGADGGIISNSPPENITRLENVYDSFLTKFPLCFGYWKKYADWKLATLGAESAEKIFERGVAAIQNSIDLWNQYLDFKLSHSASNEDIESLLERAAACVGLDFLAHPFWDKYIDFAETRLADPKRVLSLLDRIVLIPMHQYARYYEKWRGLRSTLKPSEAVDAQTLEIFKAEIDQSISPEEMESALKEKLDAQTKAVYKKTQEGTNSRWVYEAEIKRSYFHVKPLDKAQLQNWSKYLDFEENIGDLDRIRALYERCLVPCAQYEDFWLRYGQWLTQSNLIDEAKSAYKRASTYFLPKERCSAKIALALLYEEEGDIVHARETFESILKSMPKHVETILNYLHFERRQDTSVFENQINEYINSDKLDHQAKAFFTIQLIRYLQQNGQIEKARQTYSTSSELYFESKLFWMNYFNFELGFYDEESDERINEVIKKARVGLKKESQKEINVKYREYLLERGKSIHTLNRNPISASTSFDTAASNLKRPAEADASAYPYAKQARVETPVQQQQQQQQQAYGYAYPQGQAQQAYGGSGYYGQ